ncbi:MAG: FKBP-type peptidyl-prolyl cis-trans isomerase [Chloroflexota bacterium]
MKLNKPLRWLLVATLSIFTLSACQPAASPTPTEPAIPTMDLNSFGIQTPPPTIEPIVLEGATTTESGLQYLELAAGDGAAPKSGEIVSMHYVVSLPDGTELYSTYTDDQPTTVVWGRGSLLPGWEEGVGLMKVGGKAKLVLPPELAFGSQGTTMIPPNSQLVMELELLSSEPAPKHTKVENGKLKAADGGLQYYDLTVGTGTEAISNTTVTTEFTIWVQSETAGEDDMYIASSTDSDPITFVIGRGDMVFPGWENGVAGMKVGGERYLVIPPALALGETGGGDIPANATLIMEITLTDAVEPRTPTKVDEKDYVTTDSGLKYYDLAVGTGVTPTVGQTVVVHYTGWLTDGTQFDSSLDRGQEFSFQLGTGSVIAGWDEGVASMKVGGKRQLVIPAALGYGESGAGGTIPPNATLIFEVELLEIKP